ncbi:hypothetical protein CVS27_16570 [Arthrobacter glacialis]|uniref:Uncharacterized protein n=1 Tax=Arthrobacter glacialis TaxID=1664 RepID=A0A2S3ZST4_ARTGL|nr:hypothetical protein CVS27_16570 [Arthrobacter glacialis]
MAPGIGGDGLGFMSNAAGSAPPEGARLPGSAALFKDAVLEADVLGPGSSIATVHEVVVNAISTALRTTTERGIKFPPMEISRGES